MTTHVPSSPDASLPVPVRIRLVPQLLTCLAFCVLAAFILYFVHDDPLAALVGTGSFTWQLLVGQGLALLAACASYALFRLGAGSEAQRRTVQSYARLDLRGLNPLWMSLAAAVGEELLFRAALQPLIGLLAVSLAFLLTHTPVYRFRQPDRATLVQAAGVFGASVALGLVYEHVGLLAAIMVHAWIDIVGLCLVRMLIGGRGSAHPT